jgi:hypothetical protein
MTNLAFSADQPAPPGRLSGHAVDNPGPPLAPACSHSRGTVDYPPAIFEVARSINRGTLMDLAMIVRAQASQQTSPGQMNRTHNRTGGFRSCL